MWRRSLGLIVVTAACFFSVATSYARLAFETEHVVDEALVTSEEPFLARVQVRTADDLFRFRVEWSGTQAEDDEARVRVQLRDVETEEVIAFMLDAGVPSGDAFEVLTEECGLPCERSYDVLLDLIEGERATVRFRVFASAETVDGDEPPTIDVELTRCSPLGCDEPEAPLTP